MIQLALQRRVALVGVFAVLFQALLLGWHHHPLPVSAHTEQSVVSSGKTAPISPLSAEEPCEICAALHHHFSASLGVHFTLSVPSGPVIQDRPVHPTIVKRGYRLALARAPPPAEISV